MTEVPQPQMFNTFDKLHHQQGPHYAAHNPPGADTRTQRLKSARDSNAKVRMLASVLLLVP